VDNSDSGSLHVWVLRHAKAAAQGPGGDATRPLTARGRRQANAVREHIESVSGRSALPDLVLCSPAVRARETADLVMPALPGARFEVDDALYSQDAPGLIGWLRILDPEVSSLMVVGHNPTLHELCVMLAASPASEAIDSEGLATAALVELEQQHAATWGRLALGASRLVHRFTPDRNQTRGQG
jgi:phosphohistidine phosphatase